MITAHKATITREYTKSKNIATKIMKKQQRKLHLSKHVSFQPFLNAGMEMEVRTEIGKRFQSRGALKQNALSAADLNVLEYILGTINLVVSVADRSPPVWTQLRLHSHQNFYEFFTRKQFLPTSAGNAQAQLHFCG